MMVSYFTQQQNSLTAAMVLSKHIHRSFSHSILISIELMETRGLAILLFVNRNRYFLWWIDMFSPNG